MSKTRVRKIGVFNIGDLCTHCGEDTSWLSGKFVNRIPSFADSEQASGWYMAWDMWDSFDGYMCASCQGEPDKFMTYEFVSDYAVIKFTVPGMSDWSEEQFDSAGQADLESYVTDPKDYFLNESWEGRMFDGLA